MSACAVRPTSCSFCRCSLLAYGGCQLASGRIGFDVVFAIWVVCGVAGAFDVYLGLQVVSR